MRFYKIAYVFLYLSEIILILDSESKLKNTIPINALKPVNCAKKLT
jgi:hypothetical protein